LNCYIIRNAYTKKRENKILANPGHQIFVLFKSEEKYPAFISKKVHNEPGTSIVSALHCQEGYASNIGKIELGYRSSDETPIIGGRKHKRRKHSKTKRVYKRKSTRKVNKKKRKRKHSKTNRKTKRNNTKRK